MHWRRGLFHSFGVRCPVEPNRRVADSVLGHGLASFCVFLGHFLAKKNSLNLFRAQSIPETDAPDFSLAKFCAVAVNLIAKTLLCNTQKIRQRSIRVAVQYHKTP